MFDKNKERLLSMVFYNGQLKVSAFSYLEPWQEDTDAGRLNRKVFVHLYRLDGRYEAQRELIWANAVKIVELKNDNKRIPQNLWDNYHDIVVETKGKDGTTNRMINTALIEKWPIEPRDLLLLQL